jgi:L-lactate dehydrogenase complex protein LldF
MNTCPVYRRSGGHSYETHVPGPIGSILAPSRSLERHQSLPHACSLCGSCTQVCPVRIDLHEQLLKLRQSLATAGITSWQKRWLASVSAWLMCRPALYARVLAVLRWLGRRLPRGFIDRSLFGGGARRLRVLPSQSFQKELSARRKGLGDDE